MKLDARLKAVAKFVEIAKGDAKESWASVTEFARANHNH